MEARVEAGAEARVEAGARVGRRRGWGGGGRTATSSDELTDLSWFLSKSLKAPFRSPGPFFSPLTGRLVR